MAHCLILGMTESGKTTLAKRLARGYQARGIRTIVLDPLADPEWQADFQTADADEFLRVFWASQSCAVFIDEAGEAVGRYNAVMSSTATRGRHWGHAVHFVSQRGVQIAMTVRDQCSHLFLFTTALKDAQVHANEWNRPELETANRLAQGNYFHCTRFGVLNRGSLFGAPQHVIDTNPRNGGRQLQAETDADSAPPESARVATARAVETKDGTDGTDTTEAGDRPGPGPRTERTAGTAEPPGESAGG